MKCFQCFEELNQFNNNEAHQETLIKVVKFKKQLRKSLGFGKNRSDDKISLKKIDNVHEIVSAVCLKPIEEMKTTQRYEPKNQNHFLTQRPFYWEQNMQQNFAQSPLTPTQTISVNPCNAMRAKIKFTGIVQSSVVNNLNLPEQKFTISNSFQEKNNAETVIIKNKSQNEKFPDIKIFINPIQNDIERQLEAEFHQDLQNILNEEISIANQVETSSQWEENKLLSSTFFGRGHYLKPESNTEMVSSRISRVSAQISIQDVACIKTESIKDSSESSSQFSEIIFTANAMKNTKKMGNSETKFYAEAPELMSKVVSDQSVSKRKPSFKKTMSNI